MSDPKRQNDQQNAPRDDAPRQQDDRSADDLPQRDLGADDASSVKGGRAGISKVDP